VKTNLGFRAPIEAFLPEQEWQCLLNAIDGIPVIELVGTGKKSWEEPEWLFYFHRLHGPQLRDSS